MMCSTIVYVLTTALAFLAGAQPPAPAGARSDSARVVSLAITPAPLDPPRQQPLLPDPNELTDEDAAPLYVRAAEALPQTMDIETLRNWLDMPLSKLPQDQAQALLQDAKASLDLAHRASRCKEADWPPFQPPRMPAHLSEYRELARLLCLQARLQIARKQYEQAIETIQTGLATAKHLGEGPTVVQGLVGVAIAAMLLETVQDWAQTPGSPNLYNALRALPHPLVDLNQPIASELGNLDASQQYSEATRRLLRQRMEASFDRVHQLMRRLDSQVAALQTIEALRHYTATHDRSLPAQLDDITDLEHPADRPTSERFTYRLEQSKAILEVAPPQGGRIRDAVRYEITVAR